MRRQPVQEAGQARIERKMPQVRFLAENLVAAMQQPAKATLPTDNAADAGRKPYARKFELGTLVR